MSEIEREIKILNVDAKEIIRKMERLGVTAKGKFIQDVYTFDFPPVNKSFESNLKNVQNGEDKEKLIDLVQEIKACFTEEDKRVFKEILGTEDISKYILNNDDLTLLKNEKIYDVIKNVNDNYSKWIRLRQTGNETTIAIKKIVNSSGEYDLDAVRELEFSIPSIEDGKEFLKNLGYYPALHQRKMRIAYDYNDTEVVIDKWPKIPAYVEVEGKNKKNICEVVKDLGFKAEDMRVMNTDDVYKENGLDIYSFKNLDFSNMELKEVSEILKYNPNIREDNSEIELG